ncbi:9491_t:CDS:2 [Racocetra fulgida]|uniref:9491_t:CDS:1 n=1 Tax=Racocetra fulgida TaxID=60492 RepID=A0A9N9BM41_9GLOM|nr:9491_t:CDS:2 [Racocetra fulgida]
MQTSSEESMIIDPDFIPKETTSDEVETEKSAMVVDNTISECNKPKFRPAKRHELRGSTQFREIPVPRHRFSPLLKEWKKIYEPLVKHLNLQVRMNLKAKRVEIRDAIAILRVDDLYIDSFDIKDGTFQEKLIHDKTICRVLTATRNFS